MVSRVLFVEDDSKIRQVISASLTDEGFDVVEAPTGEYATSEVDLESLDLAIIDLRLPGINGIDVVRNL
ncbi:MAG: response regulator, partial [Ilumatobacteraceae bacterium]